MMVTSQMINKEESILEEKTPLGRISSEGKEDATQKQNGPFSKFPNATNPETGEIGGPTGPEPTRYGDWERKGRVTDF